VRVGATEEKRKEQVQVAERRHVVEARLRPGAMQASGVRASEQQGEEWW